MPSFYVFSRHLSSQEVNAGIGLSTICISPQLYHHMPADAGHAHMQPSEENVKDK